MIILILLCCSSIPKLRQECELQMITNHLEFLHSDCQEMVSQEKRVDLHNMYTLLKPISDGLKVLVQALLDHIKNEGIETISTLKGETVLMHRMMPFFFYNIFQILGEYIILV